MELDRRTNSKAAGGGMEPTVTVPLDRPAPAVTSKAGTQWVLTQKATGQNGSRSRSRSAGEPSLPVALGHNAAAWCWERPSTCVMGTDRVAPPGYRKEPTDPHMLDDSIRVELHELATLQDFPDNWPFQGNKTQRARQIGNAVPSSLAEAIVRSLVT